MDFTKIYQSVINASGLCAWAYFPDREYIWCNEVYFTILGLNPDDFDISGKENAHDVWINRLHPDDRQLAVNYIRQYLEKPTGIYESYYRLRHANQSWVWIWARAGLTTLDGKKVLTGTNINVTKRKNAEEQIQNDKILLRTLIDNLPDAIYIKDNKARKIIANPMDVVSLKGKREEDIIGKTDVDLFPNEPEIGQRGYEDDMMVIRTGAAILNKEEFFMEADGRKRWLMTSKVPVRDENGIVNRIIGIGHDITKRKLQEENLNLLNEELTQQSSILQQQAEDLKLLNAELTRQKEQELEKAIAQGKFEIASEVLHDIGNALVGFGSHLNRINRAVEAQNLDNIKNLALFLKNQQENIATAIGNDKATALVTICEGLAKTQTENKQEISSSITDLISIITHIQEILNIQRQFVRGHAGGVHERKPVNIAHVLDDCRAMLFASMDKKGIRLKMSIKPGEYTIKGDHTKLMQVMLNVLKNSVEAIDYSKTDKQINVTMENKDEQIILTVQDNGEGFDQETAQHLFERGFTTKRNGTGLGLNSCRSIVESHTGSLTIHSEGAGLGAQTTIKFAL